ncbi:hypothetical protein CLV78_102361 [Aliiruegeria haliotis]|uniref:Probable membrane transporter protein n=1 Tax=Aliiruegeria haliotis TaxID=1280846 RepID=A0A2T0RVJ8_9RHOB|nr:sulfite exporter TauE/SafE family protein [Aliiruegeria haliotis]PRY25184.1 hypothetical protein CLV78_102361 [Aliiruegeria haliotis]
MTEELLLVFAAFALGGILKGATGAGAPILAVPIMALLVDVPFAVAVFILPNIASNAVQAWTHRTSIPDRRFVATFALAGAFGAVLGTYMLARLSGSILSAAVGWIVLGYVAFRLARPHWKLSMQFATRLCAPVGVAGGILQGAIGLSAPVSITFLNAMQLERRAFISTISFFFAAMAFAQLPGQVAFGIMTWERLLYSALATVPLMGFMPVGSFLARHISKDVFDRVLLLLLTLISLRLVVDGFL